MDLGMVLYCYMPWLGKVLHHDLPAGPVTNADAHPGWEVTVH